MSIPSGWHLCDGTNGTPDLRNRFIIGAGDIYSVNDIGGYTDAIIPTHNHTVAIGNSGSHNHTLQLWAAFNFYASFKPSGAVSNIVEFPITPSGSHSHSVTLTSTGESGTNKNLPPYYALAFIQQIA